MLEIIFMIIGGIGLLIYGIELMKDALEKTTSGKTQKLLETSPKNTYMGILYGALATMINQKSSATTIMVVGFVNAGMMTLAQAAGIIMGANIGTTVTAQILAFKLEIIAPFIVGAAVLVWRYTNNKKIEYVSEIFLGFGLMFIGMYFLENGMRVVSETSNLNNFLMSIDTSNLGTYLILAAVGFILTAIVKSSSVVTGILIAMAASGILNIYMAMPLLLGLNIGKCLSAIISSSGANRTAKRAAAMNMIFNVVGAILVIIFFRELMPAIISKLAPNDPGRQIAFAHSLFNIGTTILFLPFVNVLVKVSDKFVSNKKKDNINDTEMNLDIRLFETPGIALAQAYNELIEMTKASISNYNRSFYSLLDADEKAARRVFNEEETINKMQKELESYLVKLSQKNISMEQHEKLNLMLGISGDVERISDLAENISELAINKRENGLSISDNAVEELKDLHNKVFKSAEEMILALKNYDTDLAENILKREENINNMEQELRGKHIERLNQGVCAPGSGILFVDVISNIERVADHIKNIGYFIISVSKY
ncbi:MAG: Na/Pi cotransporter family protein [Eubacteriales bacterium]